ncbi:isoleucine--tRNA ligase [Mesomycoplasma neurolyticum]|uniref:Isoleucine--tRNA ligase n=1 Tax=Mesomycoplasma neurolyticum TaxID=2120 RepID=A0A449A627_9BACT|nr:isoleucine--tRNA ligase [Mesomycoplasma neurolyticum]VEU59684.1 Isoleucine--tRNA ligase [Mesomycoplasma neurolyticum]
MTKEYKNTLNMPFTEFEMKANLVVKEEQYANFWNENKIYYKILEKNKNNKQFVLHDGPPYANGDIHIGHALNKVIKDIIVRYKNLKGFYSPMVFGWDTHGMPIEIKILQKLKKDHKEMSAQFLRSEAKKYALEQVENQKNQFKKLQLLTDYSKFYITLDPKFEAKQLELLKIMALNGYLTKDLKPVYWSPSSQTALAEAEIEYADHKSPSILVAFKISKGNNIVFENENLIIWTTTPWTLIANSGVAVGNDIEYSKVKHDKDIFIIAHDLVDSVAKTLKWENYKITQTFNGKELINVEYIRPIKKDKFGKVVAGHHVDISVGTGLVHMAPLFGEDDFLIGKKEKLDFIMHVDDDGTLNKEAGEFSGIFYEEANKNIGQFLEKEKTLLNLSFIKHSYPHDWRTKKPIIYRGTPQWFVSINKFKDKILAEINNVKFPYEWAKLRLINMIKNRGAWTISRQRIWGVPITIFYDENKNIVIKEEIFNYVIKLIEEHGSDIWFSWSVDELLPEKYRNLGWTKEKDIMDVWFDSGSTSIAVDIENTKKPFDLYFEGSDQYRGWFNSSIINSVVYRGKSPYKELLSHGFVVDEKNRKMSKSIGNVVSPLDIIKKYGADILRIWIANSEYSSDVSYSNKIFDQNIEIYRKIRNTIRFLLGNINDYDYKNNIELTGIHLLIEERLKKLKNSIIKNYDNYRFLLVIKDINNFIIDLSNFYFSIAKDYLYTEAINSRERRMFQKNFYQILETLTIALAPILPTTTEEVYSFFKKENKKESIHLETFFDYEEIKTNYEEQWKEFFTLKDATYKLIEESIKSNLIRRSNEVHLTINNPSNFLKSLDLKKLLIIGKITFGNELKIEKFNSIKCERCWNHFEQKDIINDICQSCDKVLKGI